MPTVWLMRTDTYDDPRIPIGEAARRLGVSIDTVRRWADDGRLPSTRTLGGQRRFLLADVEALLAAGKDAA